MKIPYYTQTRGLERYPESMRFAVYRATHKRLMHEDAEYRRHYNSHFIQIICLAVLFPIVGWIAAAYLAFRQQEYQNQRIGNMLCKLWPNNSPEPPPIGAVSPHSRLTDWAARLSFCR